MIHKLYHSEMTSPSFEANETFSLIWISFLIKNLPILTAPGPEIIITKAEDHTRNM